jgi:hypothetical protein
MKRMLAFVLLMLLLAGCRHPESVRQPSEAWLRKRIVGRWWSGDRWVVEPFALVTFYPDGRFTRSCTNGLDEFMRQGYWRVGHTNSLTMTVERDAPPAAAFQVFTVDSINDHEMVLSQPAEALRITLTR